MKFVKKNKNLLDFQLSEFDLLKILEIITILICSEFFFQISATDRLSTLICTSCVKNVNQWHTYKESCQRSQDKLQEWLASESQPNPMVNI